MQPPADDSLATRIRRVKERCNAFATSPVAGLANPDGAYLAAQIRELAAVLEDWLAMDAADRMDRKVERDLSQRD